MRAALLLLVVAVPAAARPPAPPEPPLAQLNGADPEAIPGCAAASRAAPVPFGCAVTRNLRAMLADPDDARRPAPLAPPQGEPASRAYEQLRSGTAPPLVPVPTAAAPD